jgi:hypothetical protein
LKFEARRRGRAVAGADDPTIPPERPAGRARRARPKIAGIQSTNAATIGALDALCKGLMKEYPVKRPADRLADPVPIRRIAA